MLYSRMVEYDLELPSYVTDSYNHERTAYTPAGSARVYVVLQDKTPQTANELDTFASNLVGYTQETRIKEGWRIGGRFVVTSVVYHRDNSILYLKEVTDGV